MNELQISLLVIGGAIVAGIYGFNRWQERKLKRRAEELFKSDHDDVLLDEPPAEAAEPPGRIEPTFGVEESSPVPEPSADTAVFSEPFAEAEEHEAAAEEPAPQVFASPPEEERVAPQGAIDYVARLQAETPVTAASLLGAMRASATFGKPVFWHGLSSRSGEWEDVAQAGPEETFGELAIALQLVDRKGAVPVHSLEMFCDTVQNAAADLGLTADCPDVQPAAELAVALDRVCAEADVLIGINVVPAGGAAIPATKVRAFAEAAGMKLADDGAFYFRDDGGVALYSLCNLDSEPFTAENIKTLSTHGVTLLLDVPKTPGGARVFDQILAQARQMASALGGLVVDDNRRPFTDAGAEAIRSQLKDIYRRMDEMNIPAGGKLAARLFY
jgi:FtsZ-interacting cell division protein ZipA